MSGPILDAHRFPLAGMRLIEASAGTGKTWTIANLYLRLLLGDGRQRPLTVDQILVVTFTTAATQELRERLRQRIELACEGFVAGFSTDSFIARLIAEVADITLARTLLYAAQRQMDEAAIYTIHGFCQRVLSDNAFESGLGFDLEIVIDDTVLRQRAAEDFWRRQIAPLDGDTLTLLPAKWRTPQLLLREIAPYLGAQILLLQPESSWCADDVVQLRRQVELLKQLWLQQDVAGLLQQTAFKGRSKCASAERIQAMDRFCGSTDLEFLSPRKESWELWAPDALAKAMPKKQPPPQHPAFELCAQLSDNFNRLRQNLRLSLMRQAIVFVADSLRLAKQQLAQMSADDLLTGLSAALQRPDSGARLAERIAARYPVVMVDEFQDTDSVQYPIFSAIYGDRPECGWIMIGDPKQAIYKFRGADVFTYINARRRVTQRSDGLFTLATNWRSSRAMVAAINQLFARAEQRMPRQGAFLYPRDIPFIPVAPAPDADQKALLVQGRAPAPLTFWYCRGDDKNGQLSSGQARQTLALQCAEEIVALLNASCDDQASVAGEALTPGNIAVLVRDRQEASAVKAALAQRGVNSVFLSRESVFDAPIAIELYHILQAVMQPADERKVRTALATPLLGASLQDIARLDTDLNAMQQVLDEFAHYHMHWQRFGVLSMLRQLMARREIPARLLAHAEGQRQLTDLRHLGELLQQASMARAGMHDLLRWYVRNCSTDSREPSETQRVRLESDSQLVQIVTIHSSKGLEFDIVFLPLASVAKHSAQCIYHRQEAGSFVAVADLAATPEAMALADHERLAEDLRVLYVALTRARYKCYVGLANIKASGPVLPFRDSAMAHLLDLRVAQDETQLLAGLQSTVTALGTDALELRLLPRDISFACTAVRWPTGSDTVLAPAELPDLARDDWYLTSYTALARGSMTAVALAGAVDEQDRVVSEDQAAAAQGSIFSFPRGPRYGTLLHNILEKIPFDCDAAILLPVVRSELQRFGVAVDEWTEVLAHWLLRVLAEPLPPLAGLCLQSLPAAARISEMEFTFSLANTVEAVELDALLRQHGYLGNSPPLSFADVTGVMRGFIDLVFEYGGRYFLLDYKSNFLGPEPGSYAAAALAPTMSAHRYDLQYLIYCVALHRYLGGRLPGYAVERHFGGVFYLFLRGMGTGGGPGNGVFFATPPRALIESLDSCFGHGACP